MRTITLREALIPRNEIVHPRDSPSGEATFVGLEHIEPNTGRRIGSLPIRLEKMTGRKARFYEGDIVYGYLRPYLNKVWVAEFDGYCSVDQYVFRVQAGYDTTYLAAYMRSPVFLERAPIAETPGQLPRIRIDEILTVGLTVPSLEEQQTLGAMLRQESAKVEALRRAIDEQVAAAQNLSSAILRSAFERERERERETSRPLRDLLVAPLRTGVSGPEDPLSSLRGLSIAAVRDGFLDLGNTRGVAVPATTDRFVRGGAFYIVRGNGRLSLVGQGGVAPSSPTRVVFPDLLIEARPNRALLDVGYLSFLWQSKTVRDQIEERARTSSGIYKVNLQAIASIVLPLPTLQTQQRIARLLRDQIATAHLLQAEARRRHLAGTALPAALLRRAFAKIEAA